MTAFLEARVILDVVLSLYIVDISALSNILSSLFFQRKFASTPRISLIFLFTLDGFDKVTVCVAQNGLSYLKAFHVAHVWCQQGLFPKKWIWWLFRCNQMPSTNRNAWFTPCAQWNEQPSNIKTMGCLGWFHSWYLY